MKVSWRNAGELPGTLKHFHDFAPRGQCDGKNLREFLVYLIRQTLAVEVALNDKTVWETKDGYNAEEIVFRLLVGKPRQASILVTVDYNVDGDWIDNECRACGHLYGTHRRTPWRCSMMWDIDTGWLDVVDPISHSMS